jgi:eukaryotic-like serine/threonine-protein kinase
MTYRRRRGLGGGAGERRGRPGTPGTGPGTEAGPARKSRDGRSRYRWALPLGIVALFFFGGYLIASAWLMPGGRVADAGPLTEVPELVGLSDPEARARAADAGLEYRVRSGIAHPRAPEGAVLAQSPVPGQRVRPGAPVAVTLSRGPETHALPDVSGLSERQATLVLERLGFRVSSRPATHATEAGRAFGTEPAAGADLAVPADVVLLVSQGPGLAEVPDLTGRHIDDALQLLEAADLTLGAISYDPLASDAPGRIVGQYPPGGYVLRRGDPVEVRVSGDPDRVNRSRTDPEGPAPAPREG